MMNHVVSAGRVIAMGPRWNNTTLDRGEDGISHPPRRGHRDRPRHEKTEESADKRLRAEPRRKGKKDYRARDAAKRENNGRKRPAIVRAIEIHCPPQRGKIHQSESSSGGPHYGGNQG